MGGSPIVNVCVFRVIQGEGASIFMCLLCDKLIVYVIGLMLMLIGESGCR